ncbi:MAG: hypothetical protein SFU25_11475 [Candidatus Caenarcaniphilales bacterium]|nr:hypothetical protein [Candidatus Caenarcaniphilales bacterium]
MTNKHLSLSSLLLSVLFLFIFALFVVVKPSYAGCGGGGCGSSCGGNMAIANWGPSNYQERPIYPMRGCGNGGCVKGWRSAIITPPPTAPYGGQVTSCMPVGCAPPVACGPAMPMPYFGGCR